MSQPIEHVVSSYGKLREFLATMPVRTGLSLTALSTAAKLSLTVVDFVNRPHKRTGIMLMPVVDFLDACGFELVIRRKKTTQRAARLQERAAAAKGSRETL